MNAPQATPASTSDAEHCANQILRTLEAMEQRNAVPPDPRWTRNDLNFYGGDQIFAYMHKTATNVAVTDKDRDIFAAALRSLCTDGHLFENLDESASTGEPSNADRRRFPRRRFLYALTGSGRTMLLVPASSSAH